MTFNFFPDLRNTVSVVRLHIGDTNSEGYYLQDETIKYYIDSVGMEAAVIKCIRFIIAQLSQPNFKLDWMSVDNAQARAGYERLLKEKAQELGISLSGVSARSTAANPYRADSYQTDGDYDGAP